MCHSPASEWFLLHVASARVLRAIEQPIYRPALQDPAHLQSLTKHTFAFMANAYLSCGKRTENISFRPVHWRTVGDGRRIVAIASKQTPIRLPAQYSPAARM